MVPTGFALGLGRHARAPNTIVAANLGPGPFCVTLGPARGHLWAPRATKQAELRGY